MPQVVIASSSRTGHRRGGRVRRPETTIRAFMARWAPIKIRGFIFTHASGTVPRHAVLGVGVSNEVRARQRPRAMRALARAVAEQREPVVDPLSGQALVGAGPLVSPPPPGAQIEPSAEQVEKALGGALVDVETGAQWRIEPLDGARCTVALVQHRLDGIEQRRALGAEPVLQRRIGGEQMTRQRPLAGVGRSLAERPDQVGVIGRFVPRVTLRPRAGWGLRSNLCRVEVERPHVGALRGAGVPVVVSGQDDVAPAQRRDVSEQARVR